MLVVPRGDGFSACGKTMHSGVVQDRYAGDVGDFLKYGLLKLLCPAGGRFRLGVVWYLVDDETHDADGRHVSYLRSGNRIGDQLRSCDPDLFDAMRSVVDSRERNVARIETSLVLPPLTLFYSERLTRHGRDAWLRSALRVTGHCDVVFLDPDNGISFGPQKHAEKYAHIEELAEFLISGRSLIVYHHCDRSAPVEEQAKRLLDRVTKAASADPLAAVIARRGTVRLFLLLPQSQHRAGFKAVLREIEGSQWANHLEPVYGA